MIEHEAERLRGQTNLPLQTLSRSHAAVENDVGDFLESLRTHQYCYLYAACNDMYARRLGTSC